MKHYLANLPPTSSGTDVAGPIVEISCRDLKARYNDEKVFGCDVKHESGTISGWCAALVSGTVQTDLDHEVPCYKR